MTEAVQSCFARCEKKYMLTRSQCDALMARIDAHLKEDRYPIYTICNIYYDTDDYRLIRASLEKPVYKEKLRVRSYGVPGEADSVFVELKKKFDGVVYKRRVTAELPLVEPLLSGLLDNDAFGQIGREIEWFQRCNRTVPKVFIGYDREAGADGRGALRADPAAGGVRRGKEDLLAAAALRLRRGARARLYGHADDAGHAHP